ncbi:MAG: response regulator [Candidatus Omnitrophica bacterium]|nr:response regulator [Candidatus Omnitrophota bacterium]MCB9719962.1 response regulator [Candidatus Omnitrophota bacterium]
MTNLLIVDPHAELRSVFKRLAERLEWSVCVYDAANLEDMLPLIKKHRPAVALVDVGMVYVKIQQMMEIIIEVVPHCRIVLMTPFSSTKFEQQYKSDKIFAFVSKEALPIRFPQLMEECIVGV